jgi:hypothetical protein
MPKSGVEDSPKSLDRTLDLELRGRGKHTLYRRLCLGVLALIVVAALLDVFGQEATSTVAEGPGADLRVSAPPRLRGGLLFQARFEIEAKRDLAKPELVLSKGWLEGMTLNTVAPTPASEDSGDDGLEMEYEELPAGGKLIVWTDWQVNPTDVGRRSEDVSLLDGSTPLATAHRTVTVFP